MEETEGKIAVVTAYNEEGRTTKHGRPWIAPTVRRTYEATKTA